MRTCIYSLRCIECVLVVIEVKTLRKRKYYQCSHVCGDTSKLCWSEHFITLTFVTLRFVTLVRNSEVRNSEARNSEVRNSEVRNSEVRNESYYAPRSPSDL